MGIDNREGDERSEDRGPDPHDPGGGGYNPGGDWSVDRSTDRAPGLPPTAEQLKIKGYQDRLKASPFDLHSSEGLEIWRTDPEYYEYVRRSREGEITETGGIGRMGGQSQSPYRGRGDGKGGSEIGGIFGGSGSGGGGEGTAGTKVREVPSAESKDTDSVVIGGALNINLSGPRALKSRMRITSKVSRTSDENDFSLGNKSIASSFMENLEINKFDFRVGPEDRVDMSSIGNMGFGRYFNKGA